MSEWLDYKSAAELMHRPAAYLRARNADGITFKHFPSIERWQPGGRGTRLYVKREDVERWIESTKTPPAPVKREFTGIGYESAAPTLRRLGAKRTMRALGLK